MATKTLKVEKPKSEWANADTPEFRTVKEFTITYEGERFTFTDEDFSTEEFADAIAENHVGLALREVLGDEQHATFRRVAPKTAKGKIHIETVGFFLNLLSEAVSGKGA